MPRERAFVCTRDRIPQTHRAIITPTSKRSPIRTERYAPDPIRMPGEGAGVRPRDRVPQPHRIVPTPTGKRSPIRTERYACDLPRMPGEQGEFFTGVCIVYPNPYTTRHRQLVSVRRVRDFAYIAFTEARFGTFG